jgi:hypothetical protein
MIKNSLDSAKFRWYTHRAIVERMLKPKARVNACEPEVEYVRIGKSYD